MARSFVAVVLLITLAITQTTATTYKVTPKGSPSLQDVMAKAVAGDVIELGNGLYTGGIKSSSHGTENAPITITGSRDAVVSGTNPDDDRVITIKHSYIHLRGFTVDGKMGSSDSLEFYADKCIYVHGQEKPKMVNYMGHEFLSTINGLVMSNLSIKNCQGECVRLRYFVTHADIQDNDVQDCGVDDFIFNPGQGKNGEGFYIGTSSEQWGDGKNPDSGPDGSNFNLVRNNVILTNGNECVEFKEGTEHNVIEGNTCGGQLDAESACYGSRGDKNIFRFNKGDGCDGAGVRVGGHMEYGVENMVYENSFTKMGAGSVKIMAEPQADICGNLCTNGDCNIVGAVAYGADWDQPCPGNIGSDLMPFGGSGEGGGGNGGGGGVIPPPNDDIAIPVDDDSTAHGGDDDSTAKPGDDDSTARGGDDDSTAHGGDDDSTKKPGDDDTTAKPGDDDSTTNPEDDDTTSSPRDDDTTSHNGDDDSSVNPEDDDSTLVPVGDDTTSPLEDDYKTSDTMDDDTTSVQSDDDSTTHPVDDDSSVHPQDDDQTGDPDDDNSPIFPSDDDNASPPTDDDKTTAPMDDDSTHTPRNDDMGDDETMASATLPPTSVPAVSTDDDDSEGDDTMVILRDDDNSTSDDDDRGGSGRGRGKVTTNSVEANVNLQTFPASCSAAKVESSSVSQGGTTLTSYPATNLFDGDLKTRWTSKGHGSWMSINLGKTASLGGVNISFFDGSLRTQIFEITGDNNQVLVSKTESSGVSDDLQFFSFGGVVETSTITLFGFGNDGSEWNSFTSVELCGSS